MLMFLAIWATSMAIFTTIFVVGYFIDHWGTPQANLRDYWEQDKGRLLMYAVFFVFTAILFRR